MPGACARLVSGEKSSFGDRRLGSDSLVIAGVTGTLWITGVRPSIDVGGVAATVGPGGSRRDDGRAIGIWSPARSMEPFISAKGTVTCLRFPSKATSAVTQPRRSLGV